MSCKSFLNFVALLLTIHYLLFIFPCGFQCVTDRAHVVPLTQKICDQLLLFFGVLRWDGGLAAGNLGAAHFFINVPQLIQRVLCRLTAISALAQILLNAAAPPALAKTALGLAASARIEPMAYGTFTVKSAAGISDALGTRYAIDIDADNAAVSDKIAFITSSPLALAGAFEIVPDDPSVKIPIGTRWTVGSVDTAAGSVGARRIKCATPGFRIFCEGDADSGWTLFAERTPAGLLMIVK